MTSVANVRPTLVNATRKIGPLYLHHLHPHLGTTYRRNTLVALCSPGSSRTTRFISVRHGYPWVPTDQAHGRPRQVGPSYKNNRRPVSGPNRPSWQRTRPPEDLPDDSPNDLIQHDLKTWHTRQDIGGF
jgi:hypothetical protein